MKIFFVFAAVFATMAIAQRDEFSDVGNVVNKEPVPKTTFGTKPLKLRVYQTGHKTIQTVDNQQGQFVKQEVGPNGIHQTVYRNGQIITDDFVPQAPAPRVQISKV